MKECDIIIDFAEIMTGSYSTYALRVVHGPPDAVRVKVKLVIDDVSEVL
jgi:hypothetical protein